MASEDTAARQEGTLPADEAKAGEKHFTQAEVDSMVSARLSRVETKHKRDLDQAVSDALAAWREEHDLDDETLESLKNRDKSTAELRSHKAAATKAANELAKLQEKHAKVSGLLRDALTRDAVMREAAATSIAPDIVWSLAAPHLEIDEDFRVVAKVDGKEVSMVDLVGGILKERPYIARAPSMATGGGSRQGEPVRQSDKVDDSPEARRAAIRAAYERG